jgi:hypothetical protein
MTSGRFLVDEDGVSDDRQCVDDQFQLPPTDHPLGSIEGEVLRAMDPWGQHIGPFVRTEAEIARPSPG